MPASLAARPARDFTITASRRTIGARRGAGYARHLAKELLDRLFAALDSDFILSDDEGGLRGKEIRVRVSVGRVVKMARARTGEGVAAPDKKHSRKP